MPTNNEAVLVFDQMGSPETLQHTCLEGRALHQVRTVKEGVDALKVTTADYFLARLCTSQFGSDVEELVLDAAYQFGNNAVFFVCGTQLFLYLEGLFARELSKGQRPSLLHGER